MTVAELIDVRRILSDVGTFGPDEISQLSEAIEGDQFSEVRQHLSELESKAADGRASETELLALGITSYLVGRHKTADEYLGKLSGSGLADYYHAQVLLSLELFNDAAEMFDRAAQNGHDAVHCALCRAGAIRMSGRLDDADELLSATARAGVTRAEYSYQKGCILSDRGHTDGAIEYFERAVDMDAHHTGALFRLAALNSQLGNDDDAIRLYEQALSKPPLFLGSLMNLGVLYEDNENYSAAAFCFRQILEIYPNNERARLYLKDIESASEMYYDEDAIRRQKELDQVMQIPITDFELSARSRNCLEQAGIGTLGDLTRATEQELLAGKNFGETSLQEIREILEPRGLRIAQYVHAAQPASPVIQHDDLSPQERAVVESSVTDLNLSVRARKCLSRLGITQTGELLSKSADDLMSVRNFGVTSLNEIRAKLTEHGLKLRND